MNSERKNFLRFGNSRFFGVYAVSEDLKEVLLKDCCKKKLKIAHNNTKILGILSQKATAEGDRIQIPTEEIQNISMIYDPIGREGEPMNFFGSYLLSGAGGKNKKFAYGDIYFVNAKPKYEIECGQLKGVSWILTGIPMQYIEDIGKALSSVACLVEEVMANESENESE